MALLLYIVINLFYYVLEMFLCLKKNQTPRSSEHLRLGGKSIVFVWCPCMVINNVSVQNNGGFLPGIILLTQCYYHRETRLNVMNRFCICSL